MHQHEPGPRSPLHKTHVLCCGNSTYIHTHMHTHTQVDTHAQMLWNSTYSCTSVVGIAHTHKHTHTHTPHQVEQPISMDQADILSLTKLVPVIMKIGELLGLGELSHEQRDILDSYKQDELERAEDQDSDDAPEPVGGDARRGEGDEEDDNEAGAEDGNGKSFEKKMTEEDRALMRTLKNELETIRSDGNELTNVLVVCMSVYVCVVIR
jgi:hypothetical protein